MANETALSDNSDTGLYLLIDNNGWKAANTPNTCNLGGDTGLILGTGYIYFDDFISLSRGSTTPLSGTHIGWTFAQSGSTYLRTNAITGQAIFSRIEANLIITDTQQSNFEKFFDLHQAVTNFQLYLVRQWASTTFKQFSYNATLLKYIAVILTDYDIIEISQGGNDVQNLRIGMIHAYRLSTS